MRRVVVATYEEGMLKPAEKLSLSEHQQVLLVVLPLSGDTQEAHDEQLRAMDARVAVWMAEHESEAARPSTQQSPRQEHELNAGYDAALQAIRARSRGSDSDQIAADVDRALTEARALSPEAIARLDAELDAALKEWLAATR